MRSWKMNTLKGKAAMLIALVVIGVAAVASLDPSWAKTKTGHPSKGVIKPMPPGQVQVVPAGGYTMTELYGKKSPVPVPFYPKGKVYGFTQLRPGKKGGTYVIAIEGTYDSPNAVVSYYARTLKKSPQGSWRFSTRDVPKVIDRSKEFFWPAGAPVASGWLGIDVESAPRGISRNPEKQIPYIQSGDASPLYGGDPKETIISFTVVWK